MKSKSALSSALAARREGTLFIKDTMAYNIIKRFYGDQRAKRSNVPYINHIDEGLSILRYMSGSFSAQQAYCLHPIVQDDKSFVESLRTTGILNVYMDVKVIAFAVEYRNVANAYLSPDEERGVSDIVLSPLVEVNDMLIADKVQNRADFELYHKATHPRAKQLDLYFRNWLEALEVSEEDYTEFVEVMKKGLTDAET